MGIGNGFKKADEVKALDPEYVKLQREEVVKAYQDRVTKLKEEVSALEGKVKGLEQTLALAFIEEREKIQRLEDDAKAKKDYIDLEASKLKKDREMFSAEKTQALSHLESEQEAINAQRKAIDMRDASLNAEQARLKVTAEKQTAEAIALDSTKKELQERILSLGQERLALESEQLILKNKNKDQKEREEHLSDREEAIEGRIRKAVELELKTQETAREVDARITVAQEAGRVADEALKKLEELKLEKDRDLSLIKSERLRFETWENELKVREKAINSEFNLRKRELDDREKRIITLEKGIA